jgi:excisionase family DNA binding protein
MSSNIKIKKICMLCGIEFTAKTTVTQYCSSNCGKRAYKLRNRTEKIEATNKETKAIKSKPTELLKEREFLTVTQVSKLIGCSRQNIYKMINSGKLKATNILEKKTIIKRSDIDMLFEPSEPTIIQTITETFQINISDCYTLTEVQNKYGVSEKALLEIIKRNNLPKIKNGWFAYVPKFNIDKIFK